MKSHYSQPGQHLKRTIKYITADSKTMNGTLVGAINCIPERAYEQMIATKELFGKTDKRQGYHLIISFNEGEVNPQTAFALVEDFTKEYLYPDYEAIYAVHNNTDHIHGHIVWNSVKCSDGLKYRYEKGDWEKYIQPRVDKLCEKYGLKTLEVNVSKADNKTREWDQHKDGPFVWNDMIRADVDALVIAASSMDMFVQMLGSKGYEVKTGKYLAVKPPGMNRFRRLKTLGENYTEEAIAKRIKEESIAGRSRRFFGRNKSNNSNKKTNVSPRIIGWSGKRSKRAKLSGLQKRYFARLYRLGKIKKRSYSTAWKYKDDIKRMKQLQKQYLFLSKYNIRTRDELSSVKDALAEKHKTYSKENRKLNRTAAKNAEVFEAIAFIMDNNYRVMSNKLDNSFSADAAMVARMKSVISDHGLTLREAMEMKKEYDLKKEKYIAKLKELKQEKRIAYEIDKELERDEMVKESQREKVPDREKRRIKSR